MKTAAVLVGVLIAMLTASGCSSVANEPSAQTNQAKISSDQSRTITLRAGQSLILASNERIEAPSGVFAAEPDKSGRDNGKIVMNGHGNTLSVPPGVTISVPTDAVGPADNLVIAQTPSTQTVAPTKGMLINGFMEPPRPWLPEPSAKQSNWKKTQNSFYIDLGTDPDAVARLSKSSYTEDVPEVRASKSLTCGLGYKKYLIRSFFYDGNPANVYETPEGLVVSATLLGAPSPPGEGAIAICLKTPPGRIEGVITHLWLPL
jgi:hypothetical protein